MASLVETRKFNAADTLTRLINGWRHSRIDDLMAWSRVDREDI